MITELVVKAALEAVVGQGFKAVVEQVFGQSRDRSDRQILEAVLVEVHRYGGRIGNIQTRLAQLESEIARIQNDATSASRSPELAQPSAFEGGNHFRRVSGGYMGHHGRLRKR